jgi:hypothetical protein
MTLQTITGSAISWLILDERVDNEMIVNPQNTLLIQKTCEGISEG